MHKPLSYSTYCKGNYSVILRYITSVALCIILLGVTKVIINNQKDELDVWSIKHQYYSFLYSRDQAIGEDLLCSIKALDSVEGIYPYESYYQGFQGFLSNMDSMTYFLDREGIVKIMSQLVPDYDVNQIPPNNQREALLSRRLVKNGGLKIGDKIIEEDAITYQASFESILPIGFCPTAIEDRGHHYLILAKEGQVDQMNQAIRNILPQGIMYEDLESLKKENIYDNRTLEQTFNIIMVVMTLGVAMTTGVLTYIHYLARRREVGILSAIGYSNQTLIIRMTKEILICTVLATILAIIMIQLIISGFNIFVALPNGYIPFQLSLCVLKLLLIIPFFMMVFSLIPTWILLTTTTQVTLVQRGY